MNDPARADVRDMLDWLHEQGRRRAEAAPEFDIEETLRIVRAVAQADSTAAREQGKPDAAIDFIRSSRGQVARLILELGPSTAATLGSRLGLTPAKIRRDLNELIAEGMVAIHTTPSYGNRGRGRPAKVFAITDAGRSALVHPYDAATASALRFLAENAGPEAVSEFARRQMADLERRYTGAVSAYESLSDRVRALAEALSADGYTASARPTLPSGQQDSSGEQLCQHHCPVAHVAAEFPQLCEAETEAFARLLGTPVRRLATIAHGDGICTTHVTNSAPTEGEVTPQSAAERDAAHITDESGGPAAP